MVSFPRRLIILVCLNAGGYTSSNPIYAYGEEKYKMFFVLVAFGLGVGWNGSYIGKSKLNTSRPLSPQFHIKLICTTCINTMSIS